MITADELRELCLALPSTTETFPFGPESSVFKTSLFFAEGRERMFAVADLAADPLAVTLKCDPEEARALRAEFDAITPGYHMNKKHWITVTLDDRVPDDLVARLVADSHALVHPRPPRASR